MGLGRDPGRDSQAALWGRQRGLGGAAGGGGGGFSLSCWARRTGRWAAVAGRLTVAHGKKALSQEFPPSSSGRGALGSGGVQGWAPGWEQRRRVTHQKQEDAASRCPSNISVLHVPALQAACQNVAGQGWPPCAGVGGCLGRWSAPDLTGTGLCPQRVPACPQEWGILQQPRWPFPPALPPVGPAPSPAQRRHQSTLSAGLGSVWTGPSGCSGSSTGTSNEPPASSGGSKPAPGWLPGSVRL